VAGYALGAFSARLGSKAAMACTVAVEEVINDHYARQYEELENFPHEKELKEVIGEFQKHEQEHHDIGVNQGAADAPAFKVMKGFIKLASKTAIWLSERI
jgi:ubiquinone biosynthesis monooxygenase Coq7